MDEDIENLADMLSTKWSALLFRLTEKGFSRSEAISILRMYVLGNSMELNVFYEVEDD